MAGPYDPVLRFRTLATPHFLIHFHDGEDAAAARLATVAERVHEALTVELRHVPRARTHVVLVHQDDRPNGSTTVVPWNAIEIDAVPPKGADSIGNTDDWLAYVFTHEYAHVLHLDRSVGWAVLGRTLFGRTVIGFPNLSLPLWQIEGFATLVESEGGQGRLHAGDFREIVDAGVRAGRPEPIDRVNGGLVAWPSGQGWYAYGARFQEFLVARYGRERLVELADRTAARIPFITSGAFKAVYGKSLGELWREFELAAATAPHAPAPNAPRAPNAPCAPCAPTQLTRTGYLVEAPRIDADGSIWFSASDAHRFPGLYRLPPGATEPVRVTSRYGGSGLSLGRDVVIFDQLEVTRGAGLTSDLYAFDRRTGRTRRLTRGARLVDPDLSPDGTRLAVVRTGPAFRELLLLDAAALLQLSAPAAASALPVLARRGGELDVFATPRWSPDGTRLVAEHRSLGGPSELVILDDHLTPAGPVIQSASRNVTPSWTADGGILFASDRDGGPFAIYRATFDSATPSTTRVLTSAGGALSPAMTADGRIVYVGYSTAGYDLFAARPNLTSLSTSPNVAQPVATSHNPTQPDETVAQSAYRPWPSLWPRGWLPTVERRDDLWRVGGVATGSDVLGRHAFAVNASWAVTNGHPAASLVPAARPDWAASYAYTRWQLVPYIAAQDRTSLFQVANPQGSLVPVAQREQQVDAGAIRSFRRVRWSQSVLAAYHASHVSTSTARQDDASDRSGVRGAWTLVTAKRYGYSISPEDGVAAGITGETFRPAFGSDGSGDAVTGDLRAYLPLGIHHAVFAVRAAGAASRGDAGTRRLFLLGGDNGNLALGRFGNDTINLLRGFDDDVFAGTHVALVNMEARVPLGWPERGWGTWPAFLRAVHATAFADIGHAWTSGAAWSDRKTSLGAELAADVVVGFGLPLTWSVGAAWGHDGAGQVPDQRRVYVRLGRSF